VGDVFVAYSIDLRQRAVHAVEVLSLTQQAAALQFQVGLTTLKRWLKRESLIPGKPGPRNSRLDRERLKALVEQEPDLYLDEYAERLGSKRSTVAYNLQVLNIRRKKNYAVSRAKRKRAHSI